MRLARLYPMPINFRGLRWWIIGLLMLGSILNYLTRSTLAVVVATSPMMAELHMTEKQYAWILNTFQATIMAQPVCGYLLDVLGLGLGFGLFAVIWSFVTMGHALAQNWPTLAGLRGLLGFAEGSANPAGMKATAEWFPARERGLAGGVFNIGASVGSMLAAPLVGWAVASYSWHAAFLITGGLGLVWVVVWAIFYRAPERHRALSREERDYIAAGQEAHLRSDGTKPAVLQLLRRRNFWGIALPRFLADPTWGTLTFWVPLYFATVRHFDLKHIAYYTWLPFLAADVGCMFGGSIALWLQQHTRISLIDARRTAFTVGACLMTGMVFVGFVKDAYVALALLCLGGFAHQTLSVTVITMASDLFRKNEVGTVAGMAGTFGNFGILVFNFAIGALLSTVGYAPFFVALGFLDLIGAVVLWTVVRERPPAATVASTAA